MSYDDDTDENYEAEVMQGSVDELKEAVIGSRIVAVEKVPRAGRWGSDAHRLTLDTGKTVLVANTDDCCAYTEVSNFDFLPGVDNVITRVEADEGFEKWFIYAGAVPVVTLDVDWSPGNPYYYGFGFEIKVEKENN